MADYFNLREDIEHMQRSLHASFYTPFLRRLDGAIFLPEGALVVCKVPRHEVEELEYQSMDDLSQTELLVYAAVTKQLWCAQAVHLEDGTPLIDPARLRRY